MNYCLFLINIPVCFVCVSACRHIVRTSVWKGCAVLLPPLRSVP